MHRITYQIIGAGSGTTSYAATCPCGWSCVSFSPGKVSDAGPAHVVTSWEREHAA